MNKIKSSVLIVDDDQFFLIGLSEALEEEGYRVLTAKSWADIAEVTRTNIPDLILLDYILPSLDGSKICSVLKKQKKTSNIPILLYSGLEPDNLHRIALEVGAQGVIEKTIEFDEIVMTINDFFNTSKFV